VCNYRHWIVRGAAEPLISFRDDDDDDDDEMRLRLVDDYMHLVVSDLASRAEQRTVAIGQSLAR